MSPIDPFAATADFEHALRSDIPLARAMQLRVHDYDGDRLGLTAPLAPNINDKGCAFGGSLVSLLTLAGWGLIVLKLRALGRDCDVYVQDSQVRYLAPVWTDFVAHAHLAEGETWESFIAMLDTRGRARLQVACRVTLEAGDDACTLQARFVAIART
ncbi:MAG TPA: YiiD C-terminal domain-containing protein [Rudaea sp.]|jgi:thioesterase domain-containing protein